MEKQPEKQVKVVLLGASTVGKTCLVQRFVHDRFRTVPVTIATAFCLKEVQTRSGGTVKLAIWDTAGQEKFDALSALYFRDASAAIVCYDLTKDNTWQKVETWVHQIVRKEPLCRVYVTGTKLDLIETDGFPRGLPKKEAEAYATELGYKYYETSSKDNIGVSQLFRDIASDWEVAPERHDVFVNPGVCLSATPHSTNNCEC